MLFFSPRALTDEEFEKYFLSKKSKNPECGNALDLLTRSFKQYRSSSLDRKIYHLAMLIAREHMAVDDVSKARGLLLQVSPAYRRCC